jgi:hypothetical protein
MCARARAHANVGVPEGLQDVICHDQAWQAHLQGASLTDMRDCRHPSDSTGVHGAATICRCSALCIRRARV